MTFRVLITGSRDWTDAETIETELARVLAGRWDAVVVHGGAAGADTLAGVAAKNNGVPVEVHPADWETHTSGGKMPCPDWHWDLPKCRMAGHRRNQLMVDLGADVCLAFILNHSKGATSCAQRAIAAGIPVYYHSREG